MTKHIVGNRHRAAQKMQKNVRLHDAHTALVSLLNTLSVKSLSEQYDAPTSFLLYHTFFKKSTILLRIY